MKSLNTWESNTLGAAFAELGTLPAAAASARWWRARVDSGDRELDRNAATALAAWVAKIPSAAKPARAASSRPKVKARPAPELDDEPDTEPAPPAEKPAPAKATTYGSGPFTLTLEPPHFDDAPAPIAMGRPTARENLLRGIGMSPADARGISDVHLLQLAPSYAAAIKGSK